MNDKKVSKGQAYLCKDSKKRDGITRYITIERAPVRTKRYGDKKPQDYAVGVSRIEAVEAREGARPEQVGKKRRVFIRIDRILSAKYELVTAQAPSAPAAGVESHLDPKNTGHGHVAKRPDGHVAACGGPEHCSVCSADKIAAAAPAAEADTAAV